MKLNRLIEELNSTKTILERWQASDNIPEIERDIVLGSLQEVYKKLLAVEVCEEEESQAEKSVFPVSSPMDCILDDDNSEEQDIEVELVVYESSDDDESEDEENNVEREGNLPDEDDMDDEEDDIDDDFLGSDGDDSVEDEVEKESLGGDVDESAADDIDDDSLGSDGDDGESDDDFSDSDDKEDNYDLQIDDKVEDTVSEEVAQTKEEGKQEETESGKSKEKDENAEDQNRVIFGQSVPKSLVDQFIRELFWRDEQFFADEVAKLSNQPDLDNALIYISEKYNWSAESDAAEKFTALLANNDFGS